MAISIAYFHKRSNRFQMELFVGDDAKRAAKQWFIRECIDNRLIEIWEGNAAELGFCYGITFYDMENIKMALEKLELEDIIEGTTRISSDLEISAECY